MNLIVFQEYSEVTIKHYNYSRLERGVCMKKTCSEFMKNYIGNDSADLTYILGECLNATTFTNYGLQSKISRMYYCDRKDVQSAISLLDWCVAGVFIAIVLVNLIASLYDFILYNNRDEKDRGK